jgi:hypothetical protein
MDASKSENSAVNQKMFQPVDQHRWGNASKGKIRKLIEKKSPKKNVVLSTIKLTGRLKFLTLKKNYFLLAFIIFSHQI